MPEFPTSLVEFQRQFPDDDACAAWLVAARWPSGFRCRACAGAKGWPHGGKPFTFECAACGKQTSVTAGTILHGSKLPLIAWFWAVYLMATHSNGISALQLQKQLGLGSYKSAWLLCAKLRRAMVAPGRAPLAGLVEVDETEIPLRTKTDPVCGGGGRSPQGKMFVAGAVEVENDAPGRLRLGACLLNPGELGFEPLKPVGEPDAANSRIRFDVRVGGSFAAIVRCTVSEVAKLSRLRVRQGTGSAPGRASRYCGRGRRGPTRWRPSRRRARETDGSRAPA